MHAYHLLLQQMNANNRPSLQGDDADRDGESDGDKYCENDDKKRNGDNDCDESDDTVGDDGSDEENNDENNHE